MARKGLPKSIIKKYGITKKAWRVFRGKRRKRSSSNPRRKSRTRRRRRSNPGRGKRGGGRRMGKNTYASLFKLIRIGGLVAPGIARYYEMGGGGRGLRHALQSYALMDHNNRFEPILLGRMWAPFLAACCVTHLIPKINGIIRRL